MSLRFGMTFRFSLWSRISSRYKPNGELPVASPKTAVEFWRTWAMMMFAASRLNSSYVSNTLTSISILSYLLMFLISDTATTNRHDNIIITVQHNKIRIYQLRWNLFGQKGLIVWQDLSTPSPRHPQETGLNSAWRFSPHRSFVAYASQDISRQSRLAILNGYSLSSEIVNPVGQPLRRNESVIRVMLSRPLFLYRISMAFGWDIVVHRQWALREAPRAVEPLQQLRFAGDGPVVHYRCESKAYSAFDGLGLFISGFRVPDGSDDPQATSNNGSTPNPQAALELKWRSLSPLRLLWRSGRIGQISRIDNVLRILGATSFRIDEWPLGWIPTLTTPSMFSFHGTL